ncbi:hypothetical protein TKK_0015971 [Trichogramma kaykai]
MKTSYFLLPLCFLMILIVSFESAKAQQGEVEDKQAQVIVARILGRLFVRGARKCLGEASNECRGHSGNVKAALKCGEEFLKRNKGRCAI